MNIQATEKQLNQSLDQEWIQLIMEAKELGLTPEEIRDFLATASTIEHKLSSTA